MYCHLNSKQFFQLFNFNPCCGLMSDVEADLLFRTRNIFIYKNIRSRYNEVNPSIWSISVFFRTHGGRNYSLTIYKLFSKKFPLEFPFVAVACWSASSDRWNSGAQPIIYICKQKILKRLSLILNVEKMQNIYKIIL